MVRSLFNARFYIHVVHPLMHEVSVFKRWHLTSLLRIGASTPYFDESENHLSG